MGQALSSILRLLLPWNWKLGRSQRLSDEDFYVHFDDDQSQSQLTLPVQALAESYFDISIIIDHSDPSPDLPTSDGLLSAPSSDHNNQITTTPPPHINSNNITKTQQEVATNDDVTILETVLFTKRIVVDHDHDSSPDPHVDGNQDQPSLPSLLSAFPFHFDDVQSQSQLTLAVHAQEQEQEQKQAPAESCCMDIHIIIDHSDPSPDLPTSDGLLSAPSSDHNNQITATTAPHINTNNITKTRQEVATTLETVLVTRRIGPYTSSHKILLVGEGDFSFSACLAVAFGSASNMVATSLNSLGFLLRNYREFSTNKIKLVGRGCIVLHGIDATQMATHPQLWDMKFDRIVYNFPLAGFRSKGESTHSEMRRHQKLVSGFLRSAKQMINENGQIHVRHKCNGFFLKWNIPKLASDQGLFLIQEAKFQCSMFPGYHTKYGFGGDKDFECHPSKTYMFGS